MLVETDVLIWNLLALAAEGLNAELMLIPRERLTAVLALLDQGSSEAPPTPQCRRRPMAWPAR